MSNVPTRTLRPGSAAPSPPRQPARRRWWRSAPAPRRCPVSLGKRLAIASPAFAGSGSTGITSTEPAKPSMKPLQRRSSPTLPSSWLMQSALLPPSLRIVSPATRPASYSLCPTCRSAPSERQTSKPELMVMTGMPASTAARIGAGDRVGVRNGDDQPVRLLLHRRVDQRGHLVEIEGVWARDRRRFDTGLGRGLVGALLDRRPEGSFAAPCVTMTKRSFSAACAPPTSATAARTSAASSHVP